MKVLIEEMKAEIAEAMRLAAGKMKQALALANKKPPKGRAKHP